MNVALPTRTIAAIRAVRLSTLAYPKGNLLLGRRRAKCRPVHTKKETVASDRESIPSARRAMLPVT